jgi:hypothetical protein
MLKKPLPQQTELEMVTREGLVPKDHLLRKVEAVIDFSFIHDRVAGLYCPDNGRPPLDPVVMFKALFVGYLFGIRSERQLAREIEERSRIVNRMKAALVRLGIRGFNRPIREADMLCPTSNRRFVPIATFSL